MFSAVKFKLANEELVIVRAQTGSVFLEIPPKSAGNYDIEAFYDDLMINKIPLKISAKLNSFALSSEIKVETNFYVVTILGRFISEIISVKIDENDCNIKSNDETKIKCRIVNLVAGNYQPKILTKLGYAAFGEDTDEYTIRLPGEITYHYPDMSSLAGGNSISIFGSGFGQNMTIMMMHEYAKNTNFCKPSECQVRLL